MNILVILEVVTHSEVPLRLEGKGGAPRHEETLKAFNPSSLAALALAFDLKKRAGGGSVTALMAAPPEWEHFLRDALALGANEAVRFWREDWPVGLVEGLDGTARWETFLAHSLVSEINQLDAGLVLTGERRADTGHEALGAFLASGLGWAFAHRVVALERAEERDGENWRAIVKLDRGYNQEMRLKGRLSATVAAGAFQCGEPSLPELIASRAAPIRIIQGKEPPPSPDLGGYRPPLPRVKQFQRPSENPDPEARISALMDIAESGGGKILGIEIPAEEQARHAVDLLRERGYLDRGKKS